jgi:hypothetical protein
MRHFGGSVLRSVCVSRWASRSNAVVVEHRRRGELVSGVVGERLWMTSRGENDREPDPHGTSVEDGCRESS